MPSVSIVMPLYNKEADVKRSIESVLTQTVSDFELIVVNDGSTDKGPEIVRGIKDYRIRFIEQENTGVSGARNRGIIEASTDLIAFLDADDEWKPSFLETILNSKTKFPACSVFATNYLYREVNGKYRLPIIRGMPSHPWEGIINNYFDVAIKSDPPLCSSAVAVTKEAIHSVGLFPIGVSSGEDLLTWAKLALKYEIAYSSIPKSVFRLKTSAMSKPKRIPISDDIVGKSLKIMLPEVPPCYEISFRRYIALWHRMRISMLLKMGKHELALIDFNRMKPFSDRNFRFYIYALLVNLPKRLSNILINTLYFVKYVYLRFRSS